MGFWYLSSIIFVGFYIFSLLYFFGSHFCPCAEHPYQNLDQYCPQGLDITHQQVIQSRGIQYIHLMVPSVFVAYLRLDRSLGLFLLGGTKMNGLTGLKIKGPWASIGPLSFCFHCSFENCCHPFYHFSHSIHQSRYK